MKYILPALLILLIALPAFPAENTTFVYPPFGHTWGIVRATPFKLRIFVGNRTKFNDPQGIACVRLDSWDDSTTTDDDDEITAYGVNSGDNCIIYNTSMFALAIYGLDENHVKLNRPWGITADAEGNVYVADRGNARIVRFYNPGNGLNYVGEMNKSDNNGRYFIEPRGVALSSSKVLYVTDAALGTVTVINDEGDITDVWEGFNGPDGIAVTDTKEKNSYYKGDAFVVVVDSMHSRITKLTLEGALVAQTSAIRWGFDDPYLAYAALDYYNQVIITDKHNGKLHKLDHNLNYITSFGAEEAGDYHLDQPRGVTINRYFGQILVAEREGAQYLWVGVDVPQFNSSITIDSTQRNLEVIFYLTEPSIVDLDIFDSFDRFVTRIVSERRYHVGINSVYWGLKIPEAHISSSEIPTAVESYKPGEQLPSGRYKVNGKFKATYSSRDSFVKLVEDHFEIRE